MLHVCAKWPCWGREGKACSAGTTFTFVKQKNKAKTRLITEQCWPFLELRIDALRCLKEETIQKTCNNPKNKETSCLFSFLHCCTIHCYYSAKHFSFLFIRRQIHNSINALPPFHQQISELDIWESLQPPILSIVHRSLTST